MLWYLPPQPHNSSMGHNVFSVTHSLCMNTDVLRASQWTVSPLCHLGPKPGNGQTLCPQNRHFNIRIKGRGVCIVRYQTSVSPRIGSLPLLFSSTKVLHQQIKVTSLGTSCFQGKSCRTRRDRYMNKKHCFNVQRSMSQKNPGMVATLHRLVLFFPQLLRWGWTLPPSLW